MHNASHSNAGGSLILVVGPSGVGKNTLISKVVPKDSNLQFVPSVTTRAARPGESDGKPYYFLSLRSFLERQASGDLLEWEEINGHLYGSSAQAIHACIENGKDAITDLEVYGAHRVLVETELNVCSVFVITASAEEQERRIRLRGIKDAEEFQRRIARSKLEFAARSLFDYLIVNDDLATAVAELESIITAHRAGIRLKRSTAREDGTVTRPLVDFEVCLRAGTGARQPKDFTLPRTIRGRYETTRAAFDRLVRMLGHKARLDIDTAVFEVEHDGAGFAASATAGTVEAFELLEAAVQEWRKRSTPAAVQA